MRLTLIVQSSFVQGRNACAPALNKKNGTRKIHSAGLKVSISFMEEKTFVGLSVHHCHTRPLLGTEFCPPVIPYF
jgi:hypothetical protein